MNKNSGLKMRNSKNSVRWWQRLLVWGLLISIGTLSFGCSKKDGTNDSDEYYVKYIVSSYTIYIGGKLDVAINTENNSEEVLTISQRTKKEIIIGPVKRGFQATLKAGATSNTLDRLTLYTAIHVSKNGSPFALKVIDDSDKPRDSVQISYTIDY